MRLLLLIVMLLPLFRILPLILLVKSMATATASATGGRGRLHGQRLRKLGTLQAALATLQAMTAAAVRPNTVLGHRRHVFSAWHKDFGLA